jgi:hypothetical protein
MNWISVKERLPETNEWVLIKRYNEYISFGRYVGDDDWKMTYVWVTNRDDNNGQNDDAGFEVLWWIEIPK